MAAAFVKALSGLTVAPEPLQQFTSQNTFAEFYSSSFPVFALGSEVSESDLQQAAKVVNEQAQAELGYEDEELAEMGYAAVVPEPWQLHGRRAPDAARWYHEEFNKDGTRSVNDPQWYPLGFLAIASSDWRDTGAVLLFYDAQHQHPKDEPVTVKAFVVDPEKIGPTIISLRQGDDDYENVKRNSAKEWSKHKAIII
ncbi:hypothetical protein CFE70_007564 [Pyrenophora teres f. teres 0-1]|uniref:Uncharacterized protein n=2 Tax=Pyrenophora teres f. teres TaxID=97479 RepID=E3S429_PYRTT|nr:hypothetical protein PTT_17283 [Pyrenophora teres f. teres 0-1]KAE8825455.1 hypothetical protein HRS9139_08565 [Pyrenophora teres f. teres]KAE8834551.1 hypothetical protein PTNB85_05884 [Pyrenophora teres f. teres]KAE8843969.1 hypothetical protein HRS9122_05072 [Pyrenophora teres f. teres]KAE8858975.1 hypothetical protein PTNB73_08455 [Pyrenophora teres f. teres]